MTLYLLRGSTRRFLMPALPSLFCVRGMVHYGLLIQCRPWLPFPPAGKIQEADFDKTKILR
jgi:hypothetical protein